MRIFGFDISKAVAKAAQLSSVDANRGWVSIIREAYAGAWQHNVEINYDSVLSNHATFACQTLISSDLAKLRVKLVELSFDDGVWSEIDNPAYSPVLRKPNPFQTRIQFWECYFLSKLQRGNTYVLKRRDARRVVTELYVLDPMRVRPLIATNGMVFYELMMDNITGIEAQAIVPASEIIHDRYNCMFHPLVGISPIFANGLTATQGLSIQENSTKFFANAAMPSGILTAPGAIGDETATRLKDQWEANYGGDKAGKVAVLGDGLKFERMAMTFMETQVIEQLKWTAEVICSTYHVPPYKIGIGTMPSYNNIQALNVEYYSQCLQIHIESAELCLDEGLGMAIGMGTEFDLDGLLRMDSVTQMSVLKEGVSSGLLSPDEGRKKLDLAPVPGGGTPYLQQQNYSLAALGKRDARPDPFATTPTAPTPPASTGADNAANARMLAAEFAKEMGLTSVPLH